MITLMNGVSKNFFKSCSKTDNSDNERFTVLYSGNMGLAQDLSTIIEAANLLKTMKLIFYSLVMEFAKKRLKKSHFAWCNLK